MMTDQPTKFEVYQAKWLQADRYLTIKGVFIPPFKLKQGLITGGGCLDWPRASTLSGG